MSEEINYKRAVEQLLEIDTFFTEDLAVKGKALNISVVGGEISQSAQSQPPKAISGSPLPKRAVAVIMEEKMPNLELNENMTPEQALERIAEQIKLCNQCEISNTRQNAVPGEGNPEADIVFVGEAPGADEDRTGKPFVGRAGQLLTKIIAAMGLSREQVFICNTLKCRPPENRDPKTNEKQTCRHFLQNQLGVIKPKVIVALGSHAAREVLQTDEPIGKLRGKFHEITLTGCEEKIKVMPTYHPAYLLRNYSPDNRKRVWEDMQTVMQLLGLKAPESKSEE